jgi:hypothetical protein
MVPQNQPVASESWIAKPKRRGGPSEGEKAGNVSTFRRRGYSSPMPYITFAWHPAADEWRVGPIIDDLRAVATAHSVSFYVNAKEEEELERVVVKEGAKIPADALERLRELATGADVTIYVSAG